MELRELEQLLKMAYVSKERVAQMAEREARKEEEKCFDLELVKVMTEKREREENEERRRELEHFMELKRYHEALEEQLKARDLTRPQNLPITCGGRRGVAGFTHTTFQ